MPSYKYEAIILAAELTKQDATGLVEVWVDTDGFYVLLESCSDFISLWLLFTVNLKHISEILPMFSSY